MIGDTGIGKLCAPKARAILISSSPFIPLDFLRVLGVLCGEFAKPHQVSGGGMGEPVRLS
jgi:hypothetical protein